MIIADHIDSPRAFAQWTRSRPRGSFCLDIRLAKTCEFVVLFAEQVCNSVPQDAHRIKSEGGELAALLRLRLSDAWIVIETRRT